MGEAAALKLHTAFLQDSLQLAARIASEMSGDLALAYEGEGHPAVHQLHADVYLRQACGDLGQRQAAAQKTLFASGYGPLITIGSDSPTLPAALFHQALAASHEHDVVVAGAVDGGYTLLCLSQPRPLIFDGVPWGSAQVLKALQARARAMNLSQKQLQTWYDVDDRQGLLRLHDELLRTPERAPATWAALRHLPIPER